MGLCSSEISKRGRVYNVFQTHLIILCLKYVMGFGLVAHNGESADLEQIYTLLLPFPYTLDGSNDDIQSWPVSECKACGWKLSTNVNRE